MKLPRSITIGGLKVKILIVDELDDYGIYFPDKNEIHLRKMNDNLLLDTLRHEMIHASLHIGGVSYMEKYDEESVVRCLDSLFWPSWNKIIKKLK
jgi:hypothetical protein